MKAIEGMAFTERIDFWWGELVIGIGKGEGRDVVGRIIWITEAIAYKRGLKEGERDKDGGGKK